MSVDLSSTKLMAVFVLNAFQTYNKISQSLKKDLTKIVCLIYHLVQFQIEYSKMGNKLKMLGITLNGSS